VLAIEIISFSMPLAGGGARPGGNGRGGGGSGRGSGRGGVGGGGGSSKKESILELAKLIDSTVRVKCLGGRELRGLLRGYDELVNLVLDECEEYIRSVDDPERVTAQTRRLGLVVIRGTQVSLVSPEEGTEEIANPFLAGPDEDEVDAMLAKTEE
jgi:U6 snRNA-associated Sm-like protein LSm7